MYEIGRYSHDPRHPLHQRSILSVLRKLAGQTLIYGLSFSLGLSVLGSSCGRNDPRELIIGSWRHKDERHSIGRTKFLVDGRVTLHSDESWGPEDTVLYKVVEDSLFFIVDKPSDIPTRLHFRIEFQGQDKFILHPDQFCIGPDMSPYPKPPYPNWYERVDE